VKRRHIGNARRVVVKVGSSSLTGPGGQLDGRHLFKIVDALATAREGARQVVLVSSGAISAGMGPLHMRTRPRDLASQQAAASVGQGVLLEKYTQLFNARGVTVGQVLLTVEDVTRKATYSNALRTFTRLLELGVLPIVNENDTVATHEIRFGDNDRLAALVAHLVRADALILLSDVDALYTAHPSDPSAERLDLVEDVSLLEVDTSRAGSAVGTGGMATKIEAARIATDSGIPVLLAATDDVADALAGREVGTLFLPTGKSPSRKLLWLAYASKVRGELVLDEGAVAAITQRKASLLPAGVIACTGDFEAGDPVRLVDRAGTIVARGIVNYDATDVPRLMGRSTRDLVAEHGAEFDRELVHRDQLIVKRRVVVEDHAPGEA